MCQWPLSCQALALQSLLYPLQIPFAANNCLSQLLSVISRPLSFKRLIVLCTPVFVNSKTANAFCLLLMQNMLCMLTAHTLLFNVSTISSCDCRCQSSVPTHQPSSSQRQPSTTRHSCAQSQLWARPWPFSCPLPLPFSALQKCRLWPTKCSERGWVANLQLINDEQALKPYCD